MKKYLLMICFAVSANTWGMLGQLGDNGRIRRWSTPEVKVCEDFRVHSRTPSVSSTKSATVPEQSGDNGYTRRWSTPGGLWALEDSSTHSGTPSISSTKSTTVPEQLDDSDCTSEYSASGELRVLEDSIIHSETPSISSTKIDITSPEPFIEKNDLNPKETVISLDPKEKVPHTKKRKNKSSYHVATKTVDQSAMIKEILRSESQDKQQKSEPKFHHQISVKQERIESQNQQQKMNQKIVKLQKKKAFEKRFSNVLGNTAGKFIADKLFGLFH